LLDGTISQLPPFGTHTPFEQQLKPKQLKPGQQSPPSSPHGAPPL
jgi:hypothetical protein